MNSKFKTSILAIFIFVLSTSFAFAEEIPVSDVLGSTQQSTTTTDTALDAQEEARKDSFLNQLSLTLPAQTDNPSLIITFKDPSSNKTGVQLEIDKQSYQEIKSPYTFPALGIGEHSLSFKFVDNTGATQILEEEIIILPRAPIINSPTQEAGTMKISGTGLANSELILILASNSSIMTKETTIGGDGTWAININDSLSDGIYTFTGYARKYGYSGNLAESVTFEYGNSNNNGEIYSFDQIHFSFNDLDPNNLLSTFKSNSDLVILLAGSFVLGLVVAFVIHSLTNGRKEKKEIAKFEKKITPKKDGTLTIFEKLNGVKKEEVVEEKKEEEVKEVIEEKKEDRIVTKIDFLKGYKKFDPDNGKKEVSEDESKKIKISLTSKS